MPGRERVGVLTFDLNEETVVTNFHHAGVLEILALQPAPRGEPHGNHSITLHLMFSIP